MDSLITFPKKLEKRVKTTIQAIHKENDLSVSAQSLILVMCRACYMAGTSDGVKEALKRVEEVQQSTKN